MHSTHAVSLVQLVQLKLQDSQVRVFWFPNCPSGQLEEQALFIKKVALLQEKQGKSELFFVQLRQLVGHYSHFPVIVLLKNPGLHSVQKALLQVLQLLLHALQDPASK